MKTPRAPISTSPPSQETSAAVAPAHDTPQRRSGEALDEGMRSLMEARFDHDFSRVRVHHDAQAASGAAAHDANAYTIGEDIYFGAGRYRPDSESGRRLIAHELAHTIQQQTASRSSLAAPQKVPAGSPVEQSAHDAASRVMRGHSAPALSQTPLGIALQPKRTAPGASGHLKFDSNWSYIVYDSEIRLRYFRDLPKDQAAERKKKNLPGAVQVGTIPWATNNPGNITQTAGAAETTLTGYPSKLGSIGIYDGRYSIFSSTQAGVDAIGPYLTKLPSFGKNPDQSMAATIKQYKGEEAGEKAAREAREKENADLKKAGKPLLPRIDVREDYLADVKKRMHGPMAEAEAMEGGARLQDLPPAQRRQLDQDISKRIDDFMSGRAADVPEGDETLGHAVQSIYEVEGKAAAPGVRFSCSGFDDPTKSAAYDGEQKGLIKKLIESEAAKKELQSLLGCP